MSPWSFPTKDGPKFRKTTIINLTLYVPVRAKFFCTNLRSSIFVILGSLTNVVYLSWRNRVKKRPEVRAKLLQKYATSEKETADDGGLSAWIELGDRHPDFVYTL